MDTKQSADGTKLNSKGRSYSYVKLSYLNVLYVRCK
ncbi:hypothetical protein T08_14570 [Trichinella sp. T8]|nr:hypothetical protein T08_14570 [Trichinella sp. T8]